MTGQIYEEIPYSMKWKKYLIYHGVIFLFIYFGFMNAEVIVYYMVITGYIWLSIMLGLTVISRSITDDPYNWRFVTKIFWYVVDVEVNSNNFEYIDKWCRDNIQGKWDYLAHDNSDASKTRAVFKNDEDAVAFKLRWT